MRALTSFAALVLLVTSPLLARSSAAPEVSQARLRVDVAALVSFGTRHTLSSADDPKRGIGAARRWAEREFRQTNAACGGCLELTLPETIVTGDRLPQPAKIIDVVAIQRGTERPNEVVIIQGHIDSRVSDVMNAAADAPGANDDGSGSALVLEAARILSKRKFPTTIVYAILSGEEQGLYGGKLLANYARAQGWTVKAVLNNDIVGNSRGSDGWIDNAHVRVFSEGPRADADEAERASARRFGGENDSPSRNLSRFASTLAPALPGGLAVRQVWRADRMGRGGDHLPFQDAGVPAIRFSVAVENYDHQHQDLRTDHGVVYGDTIEFMDFGYLAKVTALNVALLDRLARAPLPPQVTVEAAVQTFTVVKWSPSAGATGYTLWQRRTDAADWTRIRRVAAGTSQVKLPGVRGDDWFFGVSALAADGSESPVASGVPGGGFVRVAH